MKWILLVPALVVSGMRSPAQVPCDQAPMFTSGQMVVCQGSAHTYTITQVPGADTYIWSLDGWPPIQESADTSINIEWGPYGTSELCVVAMCSSTQLSPPSCMTIVVTPAPRTVLDTLFVCAEDTMDTGNKPGVYEVLLVTPEGCDSIVTLTVALYPEGPADLGTIYLCEGDQWALNGDLYADPGSYTVEDYLPFSPWCYREMTFRIEPITDSLITIQSIPSKHKNTLPKLLPAGIPAGLTPAITWTGPNGFVSTTRSIHPPTAGLYCLEVQFPFLSDPAKSCTMIRCLDVGPPVPPETDEDPGPFDPDGKEGMKPWLYPQPASDHVCIGWPNQDLANATYSIYNRWGILIQQGTLNHGCTTLSPSAPDVYYVLLVLQDGTNWATFLTIL